MSDEIYSTLREWIVQCVLAPGERLRDTELAERLGVSRTPVREALKRLEDDGLVETAANRWTRVTAVDPGQARELYPIIWALESLALTLAGPRLGTAEIAAMEAANIRLARALHDGDPVAASDADRDFHRVVIDAAGNAELANILHDLKLKLRRLEIAYFGGHLVAEASVAEHEAVLDLLRSGEFERAAKALEANWRDSLERALAVVESGAQPVSSEPGAS